MMDLLCASRSDFISVQNLCDTKALTRPDPSQIHNTFLLFFFMVLHGYELICIIIWISAVSLWDLEFFRLGCPHWAQVATKPKAAREQNPCHIHDSSWKLPVQYFTCYRGIFTFWAHFCWLLLPLSLQSVFPDLWKAFKKH